MSSIPAQAPLDLSHPSRAQRVEAEQINTVYAHSPTTTIASLAAAGSLVLMMWDSVSHNTLLAWLGCMVLHQCIRVWDYLSWKRTAPGIEDAPRWGRRYWIATFLAGLLWGSASWLMLVPGSTLHQASLAMFLIGIVGVSTGGLSTLWKSFVTLIPMMMVPFVLRVLISGEGMWLAVAGAIATLVGLSFGRTVHNAVSESFSKRFEVADLVEELSRQKSLAEDARAQAEAANRAKTQFFAAASHDLRQPLHALGLFASALSDKIKEPDVLNVVHSINSSVSALEGLFNELLDISKIDAGAIKPVPQAVSLRALFDKLRHDFEPEAHDKGLRLSIRASERWVHSDPLLLERVMRNLITNALRYTRSGGVVVAARAHNGAVALEVWDTGIGIPAEQQRHIFEEFVQLANPERSSKKGLGLGLSIVRRLCALLDHAVALRSEPGRGSMFRVCVPADEAPRIETRQARAPERVPGSLAGITIAVIDDEDAIVEGMRVLLTGWGAEVYGAATGEAVIAQLEADERQPDLAIVDYRLQNHVTGLDVIGILRARFDSVLPAILVTGSTAPEHIEEARQFDLHLLLKPVMPAKLRTLINFKLQQRLSIPRDKT